MEDVLDTIISNQVMKLLCYFLLAFTLLKGVLSEDQPSSSTTHCIEGKVSIASTLTTDQWLAETVIVLDGGNYHGFPTANGKFSVCDVPPGTYLVEVVSPNDVFEPVRVDISAKSGKIRARKVNILKTKSVSHLPYPLSFKNEQRTLFFTKREPWSILSVLKNPMVTMYMCLIKTVTNNGTGAVYGSSPTLDDGDSATHEVHES